MTATKPNIQELKTMEEQVKKGNKEEKEVITKLMVKAPADDLESIVSSILDVHGSDELIMTLMLEKP